jgi:hypothetical protein
MLTSNKQYRSESMRDIGDNRSTIRKQNHFLNQQNLTNYHKKNPKMDENDNNFDEIIYDPEGDAYHNGEN